MRTRKRRRREGKTDYQARLSLLKSGNARIVFRKTNRYIIGQYIKSKEAQDFVEIGASSKDLLDYGWPKNAVGSLKSVTASYLTGFLLGKKIADKEGEVVAILDTGLLRNVPKSRIYGFLKGVIDAGVKVPCKNEVLPDENRIRGRHMKKNIEFDKIKGDIEKNG